MRQVYRLLGPVRRHGADQVDQACGRALEVEAVNVGLIDRMLARGLEAQPASGDDAHAGKPLTMPAASGDKSDGATVVPAAGRFARDAAEFAAGRTPSPGERREQMRRPS